MKTAFARTYCRLLADRGHHEIWTLTCAVLMMSAWICWASWAQITLYEVSQKARGELDSATYPVESVPLLKSAIAILENRLTPAPPELALARENLRKALS
jgi:hypothetical protein